MRWRYLPLYLLLIFSFWLLTIRLFELTVVKGDYYRQLSEGNRIQEKVIRAPRGIIYDRHGQVLARNGPTYKWKSAQKRVPSESENARLPAGQGKWKMVTRDEALEIEARGGSEAASLQTDLTREYPWGNLFVHVLGYMGEITEEEWKIEKHAKARSFGIGKWNLGDFIGRTGVEEQYEERLRGKDGKELIETDAQGRPIKSLGKIEPKPGQDIKLSVDLDLQKAAAGALGEQTGAIIVSNPQTAEILTLYSSPSFDPDNLDEKVLNNPGKPLFNRAIAGLYPPGSTFKIIMAAAGLETGKINKETQIEDVGEINIGPYRFPNWYWTQYGGKEGLVNIVKAIKRSNDIFFYKVGEWVGIDKIAQWAGKFGVGKNLGIDLPGGAAGIMPTPEWRKKVRGEDWFLGDTYHVAIGQGDLQVTPLEMNIWTNVIANAGKLCQPRMTKVEKSGKDCRDIGLKQETIDLIKEGMKEACEPGGTGWPLFNFELKTKNQEQRKIETACKTGTAEFGDPKNKTHAWFTVFAPVDDPELTITVLVEGGGEGSNVAAPIARKILEEWFGR